MALFGLSKRGTPLVVVAPFLLVGLGNPGSQYLDTRHNVGFQVIDAFFKSEAPSYHFGDFRKKFNGLIAEGHVNTHKIFLLKPLTFMNLSGESVQHVVHFYKIPLENILVVHDDIDLPLGMIQLKKGGGNAGHNGLKSLTQHIGNDYWRLRVGIGHPGDREQVTPYVLGHFTPLEKRQISDISALISHHYPLFLEKDYDAFRQAILPSKIDV